MTTRRGAAEADWRPADRGLPPAWQGRALLAWLARHDPGPLIRRGLPMIVPAPWQRAALAQLFGTDRLSHCFHVLPDTWASFHEPQITRGFVHFLERGSHRQRLARAIALARAAAACAGADPTDIDAFAATGAYCIAEESRSDLIVELRRGRERIGVSIEAKFGHQLTRGQLPKAREHVRVCRGWDMDRSILLVVAPDDVVATPILRRNPGWRGTAWWALLQHLEMQTTDEYDDEAYRRFRRTVWHRAY